MTVADISFFLLKHSTIFGSVGQLNSNVLIKHQPDMVLLIPEEHSLTSSVY